jgi:DNA-binding response OmpR family regulator
MSQPRALLVVTSPGLALFYQAALTAPGLEVTIAPDAESAMTSMRVPIPALIVLDLTLPATDALDFIRSVRGQRATAGIPIVILPNIHGERIEAALAAGANTILSHQAGAQHGLVVEALGVVRSPGHSISVVSPGVQDWLPYAQHHMVQMQNAVQALIRNAEDVVARRILVCYAHGVAEMLILAGEPGLGEIASSIEALALSTCRSAETFTSSGAQALGRSLDYLSRYLLAFAPQTVPTVAGSRVLIVDDDANFCQMAAATLEYIGVRTESALTPSAALAAVGAGRYDLVILDIGLPEMSGFDVCGRIRATPGHERVPIFFITGMNTFQNRAQSTLSGGNDFIGKPFDPLELGLKVLLWIHQTREGV